MMVTMPSAGAREMAESVVLRTISKSSLSSSRVSSMMGMRVQARVVPLLKTRLAVTVL